MVKRIIIAGLFILGVSQFLLGQISWIEDSPVLTGSYNAIVAADFNYDGLIDIAAAPTTGGIQIWYRTTTGWSSSPETLPTGSIFRSLAAGDIDSDGFTDIVASSASNIIEAYLHQYHLEANTYSWVSANNFNPVPSGTFNFITLADVNRLEEEYGCVSFTSNPCQLTIPRGLDIIATDNTSSGQGLRIYKWAGMVGTPPNCQGSWEQESIMGLPNGSQYLEVSAADINLDGSPDLVAVRNGGIDVLVRTYMSPGGCYRPDLGTWVDPWWIVQNGEPPYSDALPYRGTYRSVTVTDINNDTFPDIIAYGNLTENLMDAGIEVWYGKPPYYESGAYDWLWTKEIDVTNPFKYLLIPGTYNRIAHGDFNGDNITEIATAGGAAPSKIWKGDLFVNNNTNFLPARFLWEADTVPTSSGSLRTLQVADFNHDGKQDIAFSDNSGGGIRVFRRTSADINTSTNWYPIEIYSYSGIAGKPDILPGVKFGGTNIHSGDDGGTVQGLMFGQPDPAAAYVTLAMDNFHPEGDIKLFKTRGEGDWTEISAPVDHGRYRDVKLGLINNDDILDLVASKLTTSTQTDGIRVWFGTASGWQEQNCGINASGLYYSFSLDDVNGDKFPDIIAAKTNQDGVTGRIEVWEGQPDNTCTWRWTLAQVLQVANEAFRSVVTGDFNNDGLTDIIGCSTGSTRKIVAFYQTASGGWTSEVITSLSGDCWKIISTRLNEDDLLDIVASTANGIVVRKHVYQSGAWVWVSAASPASSGSFSGIAAADFNADGCTDIAAECDASPTAIRTWFQAKSGPSCAGEWSEQPITDPGYLCSDLVAGDLSLDHLPDIVSACDNPASIHVLRANYDYTEPAAVSLNTPADGSTITNTRQPTFLLGTTSNYSQCLRYQIEISGPSLDDFIYDNFMGYVNPKGWTPISNPSGALATYNMQVTDQFPGGLPDGHYYWRGGVYDGFTLVGSSDTWSFYINTTDKTPPVATYPIYLSKIVNGVSITWNKNNEGDVNRYRIFRGTTANFVSIPSNMIGEYLCTICLPQLTYNDTAFIGTFPIYYYKIKAVDTTGNQGP